MATEVQDRTHLQSLRHPEDLQAWEPVDGYALVTCEVLVLSGAYSGLESRTYEFIRLAKGWMIDTNPGLMRRDSWERVTEWFSAMRPTNIELLTTV